MEERATRIAEVYDTICHIRMAQRGYHDSLAVAEHARLGADQRKHRGPELS